MTDDFNLVKDAGWDLTQIREWTYSIEDMEKFGITNITYKGKGEYPNENSIYKFLIPRWVLGVEEPITPPAILDVDCDNIE